MSEVHSQLGRVNKSTQRGGGRNAANVISGTYNMSDVKIKHGFLKKSQRNLVSLERKDQFKRMPFDVNALGDEEVVSFAENNHNTLNGINQTTGSSFQVNAMSVLGPKIINKKFHTGPMNIVDVANMPNGLVRQGSQLKTPR